MENFINKIKNSRFMQHKWVQFVVFLIKNFLNDNCTQKAASLTYTTLLSLVPILTLVLVTLSLIPQLASAKQQIQEAISRNLLPSAGSQVADYIQQFTSNASNLSVIGAVALLFTTLSMLFTIERAFNEIWRVEKKETTLFNLLRYWAIVTIAPFVLGTAFIVSSTVQSLSFLNQSFGGYAIDWAVWVHIASVLVMTLGFVGIYWFIPRCQVRFKHALVAGIITGIIFELLKQFFGLAVSNFTSYEAVYGAFAALPLFLLWVYISWNVILLGVEISYSLTIFETDELHPRHALFSLMDMLNVLYREHKKGNAVNEAGLRDVLGRREMPNWYTYITFLQDNNLITNSEKDEYILKRSLQDYTLWDFYQNLPYPLPHRSDLQKMQKYVPQSREWVALMAKNERMLQRNFSISLADIFDTMQPRQKPSPDDVDKPEGKHKINDNSLVHGREKSGLSGGQISDVINKDQRIKDTDKDRVAEDTAEQNAAVHHHGMGANHNIGTDEKNLDTTMNPKHQKPNEPTHAHPSTSQPTGEEYDALIDYMGDDHQSTHAPKSRLAQHIDGIDTSYDAYMNAQNFHESPNHQAQLGHPIIDQQGVDGFIPSRLDGATDALKPAVQINDDGLMRSAHPIKRGNFIQRHLKKLKHFIHEHTRDDSHPHRDDHHPSKSVQIIDERDNPHKQG